MIRVVHSVVVFQHCYRSVQQAKIVKNLIIDTKSYVLLSMNGYTLHTVLCSCSSKFLKTRHMLKKFHYGMNIKCNHLSILANLP